MEHIDISNLDIYALADLYTRLALASGFSLAWNEETGDVEFAMGGSQFGEVEDRYHELGGEAEHGNLASHLEDYVQFIEGMTGTDIMVLSDRVRS